LLLKTLKRLEKFLVEDVNEGVEDATEEEDIIEFI
jgi:hypothetical protein